MGIYHKCITLHKLRVDVARTLKVMCRIWRGGWTFPLKVRRNQAVRTEEMHGRGSEMEVDRERAIVE